MNENIWNEIIASFPEPHLLQTWQWGQVKAKYGWTPHYEVWRDERGQVEAAALVEAGLHAVAVDAVAETQVQTAVGLGLEHQPGLGLAALVAGQGRVAVLRVHLHRELVTRVEKLHQQGRLPIVTLRDGGTQPSHRVGGDGLRQGAVTVGQAAREISNLHLRVVDSQQHAG